MKKLGQSSPDTVLDLDVARCGCCDWQGPASACESIRDFWSRVEPGDTVPSGDCPECGAFCFPVPEARPPAFVCVADQASHGEFLCIQNKGGDVLVRTIANTSEDKDHAAKVVDALNGWKQRAEPAAPSRDLAALAVAVAGIKAMVAQLENYQSHDGARAIAAQGSALLDRIGRMVVYGPRGDTDDVAIALTFAEAFVTDWEEDEGKDLDAKAASAAARVTLNSGAEMIRAAFGIEAPKGGEA